MLTAEWFVGVDWAVDAHDVCILDRQGQVVARSAVAHTALGLHAFVESLVARAAGDLTRIAIGIEVPRGALVELCVERGLAVYAINPKQVDRFRDRFTVGGAKDDPRDAQVIADGLRTDPRAYRHVRLDSPAVLQLREWSRADDTLREELGRLTNQLRDVVYRSLPGLLTLCPAADEPWFWTLLELAATPAALRGLSVRRLERLLREHRIRRLTAAVLHEQLQTPTIYTAPGVVEAVAAHVRLLLPRLAVVARQRREAERQLTQLLEGLDAEPGHQREHSDVAILRSMPGVGIRVAARVLAEASQPLVERAYHVIRTAMGVAPVTRRTGRRHRPTVTMRHACNVYLRDAGYHWARTAAQHDPASRAYYQALRAKGHTHGRALRSVADRALRIVITLLTRGECFDPNHRTAALAAT